MKKLFLNFIFLLLPIVLLLYWIPVNKRNLYAGLTGNCANHAIWIFDRLHNNPKNADIVFLGSSHTMNGIDDSLIENLLKNKEDILNMGYCQLGVDLYYSFLQELIATKHPKQIIIEVRGDENRYRHPIFPYLASNKDVLTAPLFFNPDFFSENYEHLYYKLETLHKMIFKETENDKIQIDQNFGCRNFPDTAVSEQLSIAKEKRLQHQKPESHFATWFYMEFPRSYYQMIGGLCKKNKIKITFLYIPSYGEPNKLPAELLTYKLYGNVLIPPSSIFENTNFWFDEGHLNQTGAHALSIWVARQLGKK